MTIHTGNRTVTGPLGNAETYKFTSSQNMKKVNAIDRAANSPVASATRHFTYDANGYLATATDWDGNSTHWTNNSHGQPTSITEAYGAGVARTTSITYDSTWVHKPYTTTKTNVTIDDRYDATHRHAADPQADRYHRRGHQRPDADLDLYV